MCGIVGIIKGSNPKRRNDENLANVFYSMLLIDQLRGKDSTGILSLRDDNATCFKNVGTPEVLRSDTRRWSKHVINNKYGYIGHNRHATRGKVDADNAHPFIHRHIGGVHNGTLHTTYGLEGHSKFDTDSETVFYSMSEVGHAETLKNVKGPYCFVWYDAKLNSVLFARNSGRPLHYIVDDKGVMYFMSDEDHLNIVKHAFNIKCDADPVLLKEHAVMRVPVLDGFKGMTMEEYKPDVVYSKSVYTQTTTRWKDDSTEYENYFANRHTNFNNSTTGAKHTNKINNISDLQKKYGLGQESRVTFKCSSVQTVRNRGNSFNITGKDTKYPDVTFTCFDVEFPGVTIHDVALAYFTGTILNAWHDSTNGTRVAIDPKSLRFVVKPISQSTVLPLPKPEDKADTDDSSMLLVNNVYVSSQEFFSRTKDGCALCTCDLTPEMHEEIEWEDLNTPFCKQCWDQYRVDLKCNLH